MPITIKRVIKLYISNSFNNNYVGDKDKLKEAQKQIDQAQRVRLRVKSETFKTHK